MGFTGAVAATVYSVWLVHRTFHGANDQGWVLPDLSLRESAILGVMAIGLVWLGLYPQPVLDAARPARDVLLQPR